MANAKGAYRKGSQTFASSYVPPLARDSSSPLIARIHHPAPPRFKPAAPAGRHNRLGLGARFIRIVKSLGKWHKPAPVVLVNPGPSHFMTRWDIEQRLMEDASKRLWPLLSDILEPSSQTSLAGTYATLKDSARKILQTYGQPSDERSQSRLVVDELARSLKEAQDADSRAAVKLRVMKLLDTLSPEDLRDIVEPHPLRNQVPAEQRIEIVDLAKIAVIKRRMSEARNFGAANAALSDALESPSNPVAIAAAVTQALGAMAKSKAAHDALSQMPGALLTQPPEDLTSLEERPFARAPKPRIAIAAFKAEVQGLQLPASLFEALSETQLRQVYNALKALGAQAALSDCKAAVQDRSESLEREYTARVGVALTTLNALLHASAEWMQGKLGQPEYSAVLREFSEAASFMDRRQILLGITTQSKSNEVLMQEVVTQKLSTGATPMLSTAAGNEGLRNVMQAVKDAGTELESQQPALAARMLVCHREFITSLACIDRLHGWDLAHKKIKPYTGKNSRVIGAIHDVFGVELVPSDDKLGVNPGLIVRAGVAPAKFADAGALVKLNLRRQKLQDSRPVAIYSEFNRSYYLPELQDKLKRAGYSCSNAVLSSASVGELLALTSLLPLNLEKRLPSFPVTLLGHFNTKEGTSDHSPLILPSGERGFLRGKTVSTGVIQRDAKGMLVAVCSHDVTNATSMVVDQVVNTASGKPSVNKKSIPLYAGESHFKQTFSISSEGSFSAQGDMHFAYSTNQWSQDEYLQPRTLQSVLEAPVGSPLAVDFDAFLKRKGLSQAGDQLKALRQLQREPQDLKGALQCLQDLYDSVYLNLLSVPGPLLEKATLDLEWLRSQPAEATLESVKRVIKPLQRIAHHTMEDVILTYFNRAHGGGQWWSATAGRPEWLQ